MKQNILIVDDDPGILEVLEARLEAAGFRVFMAGDTDGAAGILSNETIDLMVSDIKMPGKNGMEFFREVRTQHPHLPVIFLTAYGTIPDAVAAVKMGAVDYMSKPFDGRLLMEKIRDTLAATAHMSRALPLDGTGGGDYYWGSSPAMAALFDMVTRVAATRVNVMILGESGSGKEGLARYIHEHSTRASRPYRIVDCGATPSGILESELFGHRKGAFTHAVKDKKGLIQGADQGSLFLDEIGNISHEMQCRLLRFLEDGRIRPVGAVEDTMVDCRVISATNADLAAQIDQGSFRRDLYYRLKGVQLTLPPLRERGGDIPALAEIFVQRYATDQGMEPVRISADAISLLGDHSWPGNIRELKNVVETGAILCEDGVIQPRDLQMESPGMGSGGMGSPGAGSGSGSPTEAGVEDAFSIEESEKRTIIRALEKSRGVQTRAADLLGISKRAIHYKIKKYQIRPGAYK